MKIDGAREWWIGFDRKRGAAGVLCTILAEL
jgi:hypothetical protein